MSRHVAIVTDSTAYLPPQTMERHAITSVPLTVVIGDHQPVASVSGANASWDVPVHVVSRDAALLQRLQAAGFVPGLSPVDAPIGVMHELTGVLLAAFEGPRATTPAPLSPMP